MTKPAILETLARAIHCHDGRLPTPWDADMIARWPDDCEYERKVAMSQAAAVLELVGPRELVWVQVDNVLPRVVYKSGPYNAWPDGTWRKIGVTGGAAINPTLESAQAAAQAHADAAHWANTQIGTP